MYCPSEEYDASGFIITNSGNLVSRQAQINGAEHVELPGGKVSDKQIRVSCSCMSQLQWSEVGMGETG